MKFPAYPKYKASGVEWLGDVPKHWDVKRLDFLATVKARLGWKGLTAAEYVPEGFIFLATPNIKGEEEIDFNNVNYITAERYYESPEIMVQVGDILMAKDGSTLGTTNVVRHLPAPTTVNSSIAVLRPKSQLESSFFFRWLTSSYIQSVIQSMKDGQGVPHLFQADIKKFPVLLPPSLEQHVIAEFLERESGRIDLLLAKKQELIERLKEKRTALISRTVTRGLNPDAKFKPSDLDWLGDIPAHWKVKKLKYLCRVQTGDKDTVNAVEDGAYPFFVRSQTVERIDSFTFDCEAVLTAGDGVGVGKVFHHYTGPFDFHQRVYMMNEFRHVTARYFFYFLREQFYKVALGGNAKSTVDSLRMPLFMDFQFTVPPLPEQTGITAYLDTETAKLDALMGKVEAAVERLQEYRTALITAGVTGKIDVRKVAA